MFIIKWEGKYLLVREKDLQLGQLRKLYNEKWTTFAELEIGKGEFYVFDKQKGTFKEDSKLNIIDFNKITPNG